MPLTLNQVVARMELLARSHRQINDFRFGDVVDSLALNDVTYPLCLVDMNRGEISKGDLKTYFDFEIWLCDLSDVATNSQANGLELMSDLTQIAEDYRAMLGYTGFQDDWYISESSPVEYFKEKFEDIVVAVKFDVRIGVKYASDRCSVPADYIFETTISPIITEDEQYILTEQGDVMITEN